MSEYFVVHLKEVSDAAEDWLSSAAFDFQALGMSEPLSFIQPEGEEDVFTQTPKQRAVDIYFQSAPDPRFLDEVKSRYPEIVIQIQAEQERDWLAEWKKSFQPFGLVKDHWVVPSWCQAPPEAKHKIWIDPGMAFGTGTHETTQLVAEALVKIQESGGLPKDFSALDVGTGTGILAVLARQLGAGSIAATEIESDARRVALENLKANDCADVSLSEVQVEDLTMKFDVVMANIIDGVLVRIQDALMARVKPGGWLLLSGIITEREPDFTNGFQIKKWDLRVQKGDWLLFAVRI